MGLRHPTEHQPFTEWDHSGLRAMLDQGDESDGKAIHDYAVNHALMCLASRYSEKAAEGLVYRFKNAIVAVAKDLHEGKVVDTARVKELIAEWKHTETDPSGSA
jgi:hypothetical protein